MRKILSLLMMVAFSVAMFANSYWYRGVDNSWGATAMTVSTDGLYEYIQSSSDANQFKIAASEDGWDYNHSYVQAGFNSTDVTNIGDYSQDNCYCWQSGAYYILVYYPNTAVNTTANPIICASTTLPEAAVADEWAKIIFTEAVAKDDLAEDAVYTAQDSQFTLTLHDAGNKMAIDGNACRFGTADAYEMYNFRIKSGGASGSDKNYFTLNIPEAGTLRIAPRTAANADNTRALVIIQGGDTLYNAIVQESQAIKVMEGEGEGAKEVSVYPYVEVTVAAGEVVVRYNAGLNFYAFAFKADAETPEPPVVDPVDSMTVYMVNNLNWKDVNAFVWPAEGAAYKEWPGEAAKKEAEQIHGMDVYSYTFPDTYVNVIFNTANAQTADLAWNAAKPYFLPGAKNGEGKYEGVWYAKSEIPAPAPTAKFWVAGGEDIVGEGKAAWDKAGALVSYEDTLVMNLAAGAHEFKLITENDEWWGIEHLTDTAEGVYTNEYGNVCFKLAEAGEVKVIYKAGEVFTVEGNFYVAPQAKYYVIGDSALVVNAGLTADKAWTPDALPVMGDTLVLNLAAGDYTMRISLYGGWDNNKGFESLTDTAAGVREYIDEYFNHNIIFTLAEAGVVKVIYNAETFKLEGNFYVAPEPCSGKYGIMLGETFVAAKLNEAQTYWTEYYIDSLELAAGATFTLYDSCALAAWIVTPAYGNEAYAFDTVGAKYTVTMDGIYDLYIKLIPNADELYVNNRSYEAPEECSGKYGIMLGETFVAAKLNEAQTYWTEYYIDSLELAAGATFTLYDSCALAAWIVTPAYGNEAYAFDTVGAKYTVTMDGIYDLYIKLIPNADELYVNNRSYEAPEECSGKYGIMLGETFVAAKLNAEQTQWTEYYIDSLELAAGATFTLYDSCALAAWIVTPAYGNEAYAFDTVGGKYTVTMDGIYDLYIKLIPNADELYVNNRSYEAPEECSGKYGIMLGETFVAAKLNAEQTQWTEYYIDSLELAAGATFTLYDSCALAAWIVTPAYGNEAYAFDTVGGKYTVAMDGIYDLYIKLIPNADELYVNNRSYEAPEECSGKYGIMLGETFVAAKLNEAQTQWTEYYIDSLELAAGATFTLYDSCALAAWIVTPAYGNEAYAFDTVGGKYTVTMDGIYDLYIKLIPNADELYVNNRSYVEPEQDPTVEAWGSMNDWAEAIPFTLSADKTYASLTVPHIGADNYMFKLKVNGEWRGISGDNNSSYWFTRENPNAAGLSYNPDMDMTFVADQDGEYTFTWFFANDSLAITYPEYVEPTEEWYLVGDMTNWQEGKVAFANGEVKANLNEVGRTYAFKILKMVGSAETWYGNAGTMTRENHENWDFLETEQNNCMIIADAAGEYTFHLILGEGVKVTVDFPSKTDIDNVNAGVETVKVLRNGQLLIIKGEKTYTIMGQLVK